MAWKRIIKSTKQELAYRDKHFHDIRIIKDEQIVCTSCGNELNIKTNQIFSHPFIGILQCEICWNHLKIIQAKFDEKKARKYCHICGKNEKLYVCCDKDCFAAFCKRCIKRNVSSSLLDTEKEDWKCFMCNPKPIWDLRAVCAVVMDSLPKKGNKRSTKSDKRILPSQVQQIEKTRDMQKHLRTLCDREDDDSSEESFVSARSAQRINSKSRHTNHDISSKQKTISEVDLVDSSSNDLFPKNANLSHKKDKQSKSERDQRAKSIRDSNRSTQQVSKSIVREKNTSRRYKISSDSSDSTDSSAKTNPEMYKRNVKSEKIVKRKPNSSRVYSSGSESDENDIKRASSKSKKISKDTKMDHSYNAKSKDKVMKDYDSTSESEDEHKKERREKRSETNQMTSHSNNDERKRNKSLMKSNIEDDSDNSSSKEFQKMKFQKVNRNKYSKRQLVNLEIDYTKTPMKNSNDKSKKHMSEQSNENLDLKQILRDCKKIFSDFQMYTETTIETIEQLYNKKEDEERLIMEFTEKLVKVRTMLKEKQKKVTIYQAWKNRKKSATKRHKVVSDDEQSSEECEKGTVDEAKQISGDEQDGNKAVSECDSEEIFSGNETKTPQKTRETQPKANTSKTKNSLNNSGISTDDEDRMDESKNNDKNNEVNICDALATSPILDSKEKKTSMERLNKKQLFSENAKTKQAQLTDENTNTNDDKQANINTNTNNETEIEESASKDSNKKKILENRSIDEIDQSNCINESVDMFDTSFEDVFATEVKIEKNCDKGKLSKDEFSDSCKSSLRDKVPSEKEKTPLLSSDIGEEKDLLNQNDQEVSTPNEEVHDSSKTSRKTNTDDYESLDDAEALAKKALLATDSDTSDTSENVAKLTEDLITNNTNRTEKMNEIKDDNSDVSSVSTIMLSTFIKKTNTDVKKDTSIEAETEVIKESDNRLNQDTNSIDEEAKAEKAAKKALLESNSDDSTFLSSESEKLIEDKKSESAFSQKNTKAKLALLASSSDNSSSEPVQSETNVSKNTKRNHEPESDGESVISKLKKRRLKHNENYHYKNDKKLRMSCEVHLARLNADVLKCYSRALRKSREYLARKAFKSLVNLDKLEKKRSKNSKKDSDSLTDDSSSKISKSSSKRKEKAKPEEESLMDHLKKIENGSASPTAETDSDTEESVHQISKVDDVPVSNEALMAKADRIAKENLLNSSDSNEIEPVLDSDDMNNDDKDKIIKNETKKNQKKSEEKTSKQDSKKEKSDWRRDKILTIKFSDTDSEVEREKWKKKQEKIANKLKENSDSDDEESSLKSKKKKKKKVRRRIFDSDSDIKITDLDSDDSSKSSNNKQNSSDSESNSRKEKEKLKRRRRKRDSNSSDTDSSPAEKKPKRRRIKKMASDSDSSNEEMKNSQGSTPGKSGRKNIRKVLKDKQVAEDTKLAAKEEEERLKRIAERQAVYNEMYEMRLAGEEKVDKLVLDFDTETKKELVTVHKELVKHLKPHQAQGIKFMWDACFESLERAKNTSGSGCIIAHCMGLGKTLQVIGLTHTLLTHDETNVKTILVICPLSTVLNWLNEYNTWLKDLDDFEVYELTKFKKNFERKFQLQRWQKTGGVMIIGYEMFRNLTGPNRNIRKGMKEAILECLVDPGADLIVCDEGHLLKNEDTALSKCMRSVKTMRRIVLTGTPLQNNLIEYHCMVQFVKPNLLGTKKEFLNRFVNPITNGQFDDSTAYDVKLMKKRAHVLHKMLEGSVQRFDYSVLTPFLPPKQEYVIFIRLTDVQLKMYRYYLENLARRNQSGGGRQGGSLFADFQALQRIWTHPVVLRLNAEKIEKANEKKDLSESEGSLKDFINDDSSDTENINSNSDSSSDSDVQALDDENKPIHKRKTRNNPGEEEPEEVNEENSPVTESEWWSQFVQPEHFEDMRVSAKLLLLFGILKESEQIGDKVLVFSQSLYSLTLIEEFLRRIDDQTQNGEPCDTLDSHTGSWSLGLDYFRLDGQTSPENRNIWCKIFNRPTNTRARLFLISTRAGGLGINLTAANRVIIFDASWNPSHDVQSIFRIYRFGQKKPCYVYRFLAAGTMEEKIYNRQVTKLSLSCRVVDEQQIERHYSNHNLNELYTFEGYDDKEKPTLNLPKDRLLAEIFLKFKDSVENYHEHDSLLENKAEEELDEEERKQAWLEYEEEKKGKPPINPNLAYQNNVLLQQYNMMMNSVQSTMMSQNMSLRLEYENFQQLIRKDYPNATPEQQKIMTDRAFRDMYTYWENSAALQRYNTQPVQAVRNPMAISNFQQRPQVSNFQQRPHVPNNSNVHQEISQLNQLLSGQSASYVNKPVQPSSAQIGDLLPNRFTYQNASSTNNTSGNTDQDVIEVLPTTSNTGVTRQSGISSAQVAAPPIDNSKIQEE